LEYLRAFCAFRERESQSRNVPRNRVLDNDELIALALNEVQSIAEMKGVEWISRRPVSRFGEALAELGAQASRVPEAALPACIANDATPVNKNKLDRLRRVVADQAKQFGISPELLSRRRDLEAIIKSANQGRAMLPNHLLGWREGVVGIPLLAAIGQS
jgi:ribonuclease D